MGLKSYQHILGYLMTFPEFLDWNVNVHCNMIVETVIEHVLSSSCSNLWLKPHCPQIRVLVYVIICVKIIQTSLKHKITPVQIYMSVWRHYDTVVYMRNRATSFNFVLSIKLLGCFLINRRYKLALFFIIKIILAETKVQ